ncbi:MAG: alpha/beta hydrolase [Gammaproteobacteria bacterium]|nr:alpha/beta hydrolase [Gammaproteobacteria bacterium]
MKGDYVRVDDELEIYYEQAGEGENTILLLPGWTMSTRVFERQLEYFDQSEQYRFITLDPRAQGRSSKTSSGHDYEQHGRDLQSFVEALQLDNFILGGWSFGCLAMLAYIHQFNAERLSGLLMLDGPPRAAAEDNLVDWASYRYDDADGRLAFYTEARLSDPEATNREFAAWMLEDKSEENIRWLLDITEQTPDEVAAALNTTSTMLDYRTELRALEGKLPLWYLVRADHEKKVNDWAFNNTPSARVQAFGEHLMFWERAAEFNAALAEFMRRCWP